jgi:hypothetical protein
MVMARDTRLERDTRQLIEENGLPDVIASIAAWCQGTGRKTVSRRLGKVYESLITARPNADRLIKDAGAAANRAAGFVIHLKKGGRTACGHLIRPKMSVDASPVATTCLRCIESTYFAKEPAMREIKNRAGYTARCELKNGRVKGTFIAYRHKRPFDVKLHDDGTFFIGFGGSGSTRFVWGKK